MIWTEKGEQQVEEWKRRDPITAGNELLLTLPEPRIFTATPVGFFLKRFLQFVSVSAGWLRNRCSTVTLRPTVWLLLALSLVALNSCPFSKECLLVKCRAAGTWLTPALYVLVLSPSIKSFLNVKKGQRIIRQ